MMYIYFNESCLTVQNADDIDKIERSIHDYNESGKSKMIYLDSIKAWINISHIAYTTIR